MSQNDPKRYEADIARALATPGGHLSIGCGGYSLVYEHSRLSGYDCDVRKLTFGTNRTTLKGVDPDGSQRAWDLYVKRCLALLRSTTGCGGAPGRTRSAAHP